MTLIGLSILTAFVGIGFLYGVGDGSALFTADDEQHENTNTEIKISIDQRDLISCF